MERVGAAYRAFAFDADTYPAAAVALAVKEAIEDAESRISDDHLTVDEAEFYIKRVRTYEALLGSADPVTGGDLAAWAHLADAADRALTFDGLSGTGRELLLECATNARQAAGDDGDTVAPEAKPAGKGTGVIADDAAWGRIADAAEQALAATDLSPTGREEMTNLRAAAHVAAARHVKQTGAA